MLSEVKNKNDTKNRKYNKIKIENRKIENNIILNKILYYETARKNDKQV